MTRHPSDLAGASRHSLPSLFLGLLLVCLPWPTQAAMAASSQAPVLRIQGSNTVGAKLAPMLIAGLFEQKGLKNINIAPAGRENEQRVSGRQANGQIVWAEVAAHGSSTGFQGLAEGSADLAASSRPIKSAELALLRAHGDLESVQAEQVIAIDGLAIVVHPDNPVNALDTRTLARLFAGEIANWAMIGGPDRPVSVHARDDNSGTYDTFKELVLAAQSVKLTAGARRYESNDRLAEAVAADPGGIGFVGLASVGKAKALAIADGQSRPMPPSLALIATEDYPLSRRLFLYALPSNQTPWTRELIDFAHSEAGQAIVARSGYVPQTIEAIEQSVDAQSPEAYRTLAAEARRLTVNFRFAEGSARLDNKAQRDISRLVDYLTRHDKRRGHVVLVGFGDAKSDPSRAALLSKLRAMTVRRELTKQGIYLKAINGLGDDIPVASNLGDRGRQKNRRVEVWVY